MSHYGKRWTIDGLISGLIMRGSTNGRYIVVFEREFASLEQIEAINWERPTIEYIGPHGSEPGLPEGYGFEVEDIKYDSGAKAYRVVLKTASQYLGDVTEGDFLWYLADREPRQTALRDTKIRDLLSLHPNRTRPMPITTSMEELLYCACRQNFVPVVDDAGSFIGIVGRGDVIRYFAQRLEAPPREQITVSVPAAS